MTAKALKALVLGGGLGGLAFAYRLAQEGARRGLPVETTILEASGRPGGAIRTEEREGFLLEHGPDCFLSEKPSAVDLSKELGIEKELIGTNPAHRRSFILRGDRLHAVPEGLYLLAPSLLLPFAASGLLSWRGKCRALLDLFLPRAAPSEDESLGSFVRRRLGREMLERVAQPMIAGIYAADPDALSLRATMPRFLELEREYGSVIRGLRARKAGAGASRASGPRYSLFVSYRRGIETLTRALAGKLPPASLRTGAEATSLERTGAGTWRVGVRGAEPLDAEIACVALPARAAARLLRPVSPPLAEALGRIPQGSIATANFAFRRDQVGHPLDGMGFVVPAVERRPVMACSFSSQKFAGRAPSGHVLLRAFVGGAAHKEILDRPDGEILEEVGAELRRLLRIEGAPLFTTLSKYVDYMPHFAPGHLSRVAAMEKHLEPLRGLALVGNHFDGVGIPDNIARADRSARALFRAFRS